MTTDTKTGEMFVDADGKIHPAAHMVAKINAVAVKIVFPFVAQKDVRLYLCGMNIRPLDAGGVIMPLRDVERELPTWIPYSDAFELLQESAPKPARAKVDKPLNTAGKGETKDPTVTTTTGTDTSKTAKPQAQQKDGKWPFPKKEGAAADSEMEVG